MTKFIGIVGAAGSGKDTLADFLSDALRNSGHSVAISHLAQPIKDIAMYYYGLSVDDAYTHEGKERLHPHMAFDDGSPMTNRNVLEEIGDKLQELDPLVLLRYVETEAEGFDYILIPDLRTKRQEEYIKDELGGFIIRVRRPEAEKDLGEHHTAQFFLEADPDYEIHNDGTLDDLEESAGEIIPLIKEPTGFAYLACPYSHEDPEVRRRRFELVTRVTGRLMQEGENIYSPITHSHPVAEACELPDTWAYWEKIDRPYLEASRRLYVLMLPGWQESTGVQAEIKMARAANIPVDYIAPSDYLPGDALYEYNHYLLNAIH